MQSDIGSDFLEITAPDGLMLGQVNYGGGKVSTWYHHVAVIKDRAVYDKMTGRNGMPFDSYKNLFEYNDILNFNATDTISFKINFTGLL